MQDSRIRAPIRVLEEVLGEPASDPGSDKTSTQFIYAFEGEEIAVFDWHKPEWGDRPECLIDPQYVWRVDGVGREVSRFCAWLSGEVIKRVSPDLVDLYRWPLPGDPQPTPPPPTRPPPRPVPPKVRAKSERPAAPPIDAHRRRTTALQVALDAEDPITITELRSDLSRLSTDAQTLAELLAREPELSEAEARERMGRKFESACFELDELLRAQGSPGSR